VFSGVAGPLRGIICALRLRNGPSGRERACGGAIARCALGKAGKRLGFLAETEKNDRNIRGDMREKYPGCFTSGAK